MSYNAGYADAKKKYSIWITCFNCKEHIEVQPESEIHIRIIELTTGLYSHISCKSNLFKNYF